MKSRKSVARLGASLVALTLATVASSASADSTNQPFALNRFEPSERGSHWFVMESLDFRGMARPAVGVVGDYQYRPLVLTDPTTGESASVVRRQLTMHAGASLVVAESLRFAVSMPFVLDGAGAAGRYEGVDYRAVSGDTAPGDLRFGFDVKLFGQGEDAIAMALGIQAFIPTGDKSAYASDGFFRGAPRLLIAGSPGVFTYALKGGVTIRGEEPARDFAGSTVGYDLFYGASVGLRLANRRVVVGPEVYGSTPLVRDAFTKAASPLEALLGLRYLSPWGLRVGVGAGPGILRAYGTPELRVVGSLEWMLEPTADKDADGVPDGEDACPDVAGVRSADPDKNGCPAPKALVLPPKPADRDGDGVLDEDDACPDTAGQKTDDPKTNGCADKDGDGFFDPVDACVDQPGIASEDPKRNGCPDPDRDKDGIANDVDACPDTAGVQSSDPKLNGCPDPDRDKDGIANDVDACPDEPGKPDTDPKRNGCPKAFVAQGQIKILDQVKFKTGSAQILPGKDSEEVLSAVLEVLQKHAEITKVRIEGHTDNTGKPKTNTKLSADRAASVVKWLVGKGIAKDRLTSQGFGPDRPIDSNSTEEGRRNNRRVEFHIESPAPGTASPGTP